MVVLENYKKVLDAFAKANNDQRVRLFAVLKMDEVIDKWSVLLSADWVNDENRQAVFRSFIMVLQDNLSMDELDEVARIVFYTPDEHLVRLFFEKFKEGQYIKEDAKLNGNVIHEGYIIALNDSSSEATDQTALL